MNIYRLLNKVLKRRTPSNARYGAVIPIGKECNTCHRVLTLDSFYKEKSRKDGLMALCKECKKVAHDKYLKTDRGKQVRANIQRRYTLSHKDMLNKYGIEYYHKSRKIFKVGDIIISISLPKKNASRGLNSTGKT